MCDMSVHVTATDSPPYTTYQRKSVSNTSTLSSRPNRLGEALMSFELSHVICLHRLICLVSVSFPECHAPGLVVCLFRNCLAVTNTGSIGITAC